MAWVLITGEDVNFLHDALQMLRPAGQEIVSAPDGATALQLLVDVAQVRDMIVLLRREMGQMDIAAFLGAATINDRLKRRHAYLLLDGLPGELPEEVEQVLDRMSVPMLAIPTATSDVDGWADVLDAIDLAARQLPAHQLPL